jgi:hypothetical protein
MPKDGPEIESGKNKFGKSCKLKPENKRRNAWH